MFLIKILVCLLLLCCCVNAQRNCNSCVVADQCPALTLLESADSPNMEQLKKALCGIGIVNGKRKPKICCSDFSYLNARFNVPEETNIEEHKNIALLPETCGLPDGDRIIGGELANLYEYPWMVLISYITGRFHRKVKKSFNCGGTIINDHYILTAAHCVKGKKIAGVRIGEYDTSTREDCQGEYPSIICENHIQDISVKKSIVHEDYSRFPVRNDIALLRLKKQINFSHKNVAPICLPIYDTLRNMSLDGKPGTVAGWGLTEFDTPSNILRKVEIPIMSNNECKEYYESDSETTKIDIDKQLCAGSDGTDSCRGDSGGPLMVEEDFKDVFRIIQFGVVSFGPQQCGASIPGIYTDVRKYMKWILDNIEE